MIVRNSAERLRTALASVAEEVEEIVIVDTEPEGSKDGTIEIAQEFKAKIGHFPWIDDFAAARNHSFKLATHDLVLWIDDDDVVMNAKLLIDSARAWFSQGITELWVDYDYVHDKHGNCRTRHKRERFLHRRMFEWRERIHETPCALYLSNKNYIPHENGYIKHTSMLEEELRWSERLARNLRIFQDMEKKGEIGHRLFYLYANALRSAGKLDDALAWYHKYTSTMADSSHHYAALIQTARCYLQQKKVDQARTILGEAIMRQPAMCSAYVYMARCYGAVRRWDEAANWATEAKNHIDGAKLELNFDPTELLALPRYVLAESYKARGEFKRAYEEIRPAFDMMPDQEELLETKNFCEKAMVTEALADAWELIKQNLEIDRAEGVGDVDEKIESLAESMPRPLELLPDVMKYKRRPARTGQRSIGIFCPVAYEPWGPDSEDNGIGGSETAVIQMSRELAKLDWDVTVYSWTRGQRDRVDGVAWQSYLAYNHEKDLHDLMVWWRDPRAPISYGMNCKASVFWAHDVLAESAWFMDPAKLYDKVMVLSEYHKELYQKRIPEELLWVTRNGLDPKHFVEPKNGLGKIIYTSCPSRGLVHLMRNWTRVLDSVPDAELHIYYGWNKAFEVAMQGSSWHRKLYLEIENLKKQQGVYWHGRVGKKELYEAMSTAHIWAYPCNFPEISCITAMEAQAHGCTPVVNNFAALKETVQFGIRHEYKLEDSKAEVQRYMNDVIQELKAPAFPSKEKMIAWARQTYLWSTVAKEWDALFSELVSSSVERRLLKPGQMPEQDQPEPISESLLATSSSKS